MSEIKLLPCPFCGGEAEIREYDNRDIHGYVIGKRYTVGCKDDSCQCLMGAETPLYKTKESAIEKWNTRKPMERIVERLEEEKEKALKLWDGNSRYKGFVQAIKIVRNGGKE